MTPSLPAARRARTVPLLLQLEVASAQPLMEDHAPDQIHPLLPRRKKRHHRKKSLSRRGNRHKHNGTRNCATNMRQKGVAYTGTNAVTNMVTTTHALFSLILLDLGRDPQHQRRIRDRPSPAGESCLLRGEHHADMLLPETFTNLLPSLLQIPTLTTTTEVLVLQVPAPPAGG